MSRSTDAGYFFQTTTSIEDSARKDQKQKNNAGNPIRLPSKILAITPDIKDEGAVYVAEAAGLVKRVVLETGEISHTFRPSTAHPAPLTCLTTSATILFAGSWAKNIFSWPLSSSTYSSSTGRFSGHADFVKALLFLKLDDTSLLVSASADATIIIWNAETGNKLHTLKGHTRGVQTLALESQTSQHGNDAYATIFSGDSSREIRRWYISPTKAFEIPPSGALETAEPAGSIEPLNAHETSIYALKFDADSDLWTASADKNAKCLVRERAWAADTVLTHPDFVRDIVIDDVGGWVVTACRDEEVRVWEKASGKLYHTFSGHYEEVTGLCLVGRYVVSVSIDGTIRRWSLKVEDLKKAKEEAESGQTVEEKPTKAMLTEDEEKELAELMEESD